MYCRGKVIGNSFHNHAHRLRARVCNNEQDTTAQASALKTAGCEHIFREKATGGRWTSGGLSQRWRRCCEQDQDKDMKENPYWTLLNPRPFLMRL